MFFFEPVCYHEGPSHLVSRQGVEAPTFSLNGLTRQMMLTSTYASAFDSIIPLRVGLLYQRNYLKCLLFHHPKMSAKWHSFHLSAPQTITAPYITQLSLKVFLVQARPQTLACSRVYMSRSCWNSFWNVYEECFYNSTIYLDRNIDQ